MQIIVFTINSLLKNINKLINKKLINCYIKWNKIYKISYYNNFTKNIFKEFDISYNNKIIYYTYLNYNY